MHMHNGSYNLSRAYGLARTFVSDVCQHTSLNLLKQSCTGRCYMKDLPYVG